MIFSIIIPTYNRALLLDKCLQSLVKQTFKDFEVIVCDDGSTDNTKEITDKYINILNIKYIWEQNWGGPARPRNRGISVTQGEWICFLDSDDLFYPDKLKILTNYLNDFDLIYHNLLINNNDDNNKKKKGSKSRQLNKKTFKNLMLRGNTICNSSVCIRKDFLNRLGGLSENKELIAVEDFDLWIRASLQNCRFKLIPKILGEYWSGGGNISSFGTLDVDRAANVYNQYIHLLSQKDSIKHKAFMAYSYGIAFQRENNKTAAIEKYKYALIYGELRIKLRSIYRILFS